MLQLLSIIFEPGRWMGCRRIKRKMLESETVTRWLSSQATILDALIGSLCHVCDLWDNGDVVCGLAAVIYEFCQWTLFGVANRINSSSEKTQDFQRAAGGCLSILAKHEEGCELRELESSSPLTPHLGNWVYWVTCSAQSHSAHLCRTWGSTGREFLFLLLWLDTASSWELELHLAGRKVGGAEDTAQSPCRCHRLFPWVTSGVYSLETRCLGGMLPNVELKMLFYLSAFIHQ